MWRRFACVVMVAIVALAAETARAQEAVTQFYKGKQITVLVGSSAGGGYDIYARLLSRHIPKHMAIAAAVAKHMAKFNIGANSAF